ncbi:MAG: aldo/keto reductase [Candidatus Cloacimonadota bacterium]|nr:MAG: aldo/keto reductase [Candidatus Cloacimonadota bacterium]
MNNQYKTLKNQVKIPSIGLGVYLMEPGDQTRCAIQYGIKAGYTHFDTAQLYQNEQSVTDALNGLGIKRENFFITTKINRLNHGYDNAIESYQQSLDEAKLKYFDLLLIHWPEGPIRKETWKALEHLYREKRCRAIGVSNYTIKHLEEMKEYAEILPMVNQVEFHPYLYQKKLLNYCQKNDILLQAYSPLTHGEKINDEKLSKISLNYNKTNAQILIKWGLQQGLVVLPKSTKEHRIQENFDVFDFEINNNDMDILNSLNENLRTCWNPSNVE